MTVIGQGSLPHNPTTDYEPVLKRVQAFAGTLFAVFVLLHLSNIFIAPFGAAAFNEYQSVLRMYYQTPLIEVLLVLGPLVVHMIAGAWLACIRAKRGPRPLTQRIHTWAGVFLFAVVFGHVLAVRGPSYFYGISPEFEGLSFSLWYFPAYFYPYYLLLALAGFYHATNGLRLMAARRGFIVSARTHAGFSLFISAWIVVSLLALGGVLFEVPVPTDNPFAQLISDLTGIDPNQPIRIWNDD